MGQKPSQHKVDGPLRELNAVDPHIVLEPFDRRSSNNLTAYELLVPNREEGSHHRGLYFPEWRVVFYIADNKLCARHQIYNDIKSRKITIAASDVKVFLTAYLTFQQYCVKMEEATPVFKGYLETFDYKR